ncbi:MAG: hypothetical protein NTU60_11460 [Candidatus Aminicenantes bacterium]|nr:hypothetical protein [Candidatus Aminicenantes bacterium]
MIVANSSPVEIVSREPSGESPRDSVTYSGEKPATGRRVLVP